MAGGGERSSYEIAKDVEKEMVQGKDCSNLKGPVGKTIGGFQDESPI